ncbi:MAG: nitrite reductase small subunit NirD [Pseudomonadota bacterium]
MNGAVIKQPDAAESKGLWRSVCRLDDIVENTGVAVLTEVGVIALFRLSGARLFAIDNCDPFSETSILSRGIVGDVDGEPVVASPIYKQQFRLRDGQCVEDDSVRLRTFDVSVEDGSVLIRTPRDID